MCSILYSDDEKVVKVSKYIHHFLLQVLHLNIMLAYIAIGLPINPFLPGRRYTVHYQFLIQHYISFKMTYLIRLTLAAFSSNSNVTYVTLERPRNNTNEGLKYFLFKTIKM